MVGPGPLTHARTRRFRVDLKLSSSLVRSRMRARNAGAALLVFVVLALLAGYRPRLALEETPPVLTRLWACNGGTVFTPSGASSPPNVSASLNNKIVIMYDIDAPACSGGKVWYHMRKQGDELAYR